MPCRLPGACWMHPGMAATPYTSWSTKLCGCRPISNTTLSLQRALLGAVLTCLLSCYAALFCEGVVPVLS